MKNPNKIQASHLEFFELLNELVENAPEGVDTLVLLSFGKQDSKEPYASGLMLSAGITKIAYSLFREMRNHEAVKRIVLNAASFFLDKEQCPTKN